MWDVCGVENVMCGMFVVWTMMRCFRAVVFVASERRMEKQILAEEGERGKLTNSHLTRTAEALSATLSVSVT